MFKCIRHSCFTFLTLAGLSGLMMLTLAACDEKVQQKPLTGVDLFVQTCATPGELNADCKSRDSIEKAFGFDLMTEIDSRHQKMRKTAAEIVAGKLTDEQYKSCLADKSCVEVPMLDEKKGEETPHAKEISRAFWALADGKDLTLGICRHMPVCAVALENGVVVARKNKIVAAKAGKS